MTEYAKGGVIPTSENAEPIKVRLSKGCFYCPPESVAHYGEEFMAKLNEMKMSEFSIHEEDL